VARPFFRSSAVELTFGKTQFSEVLDGSMRRLPRLLPLLLGNWVISGEWLWIGKLPRLASIAGRCRSVLA
jgi:hypothetical protein